VSIGFCRAQYPPFDGEGASRAGGRWNSKSNRVIYTSENRSLAVLEILVHLSDVLPDKYVLASADLRKRCQSSPSASRNSLTIGGP
jgi:RES domain-containing protein